MVAFAFISMIVVLLSLYITIQASNRATEQNTTLATLFEKMEERHAEINERYISVHREMIERWDKRDQEASERYEKLMQQFQQDREKSDAKHCEFMDYIAKRDKRGRFRKHR